MEEFAAVGRGSLQGTDCVFPHVRVVWVLPLLELIREVDSEVVASSIVRSTAQPDIAISIQHHIGPGCYHQQIYPDVKLASTQQERWCDVAESRGTYPISHVYCVLESCRVDSTVAQCGISDVRQSCSSSDQPPVCPRLAVGLSPEISPYPDRRNSHSYIHSKAMKHVYNSYLVGSSGLAYPEVPTAIYPYEL